jgi:2-iminoacetate synthase ThiH
VNELTRYLMEKMCIDFQGDISMKTIQHFLASDSSPEARMLLGKLQRDEGVDDMLIALADCLKEHIRSGISEEKIQEQLFTYAESLPA